MKRICIIAVLTIAVSSLVQGQTKSKEAQLNSSVEQELRKLEDELRQAELRRDAEAIDRIFADDFINTDILGRVTNKAHGMAALKTVKSADLRMDSMENDDVQVRIFGDAALVTGRTVAKGQVKGQDFNTQVRFTRVYVKRRGIWQLVANQLTRIGQQ